MLRLRPTIKLYTTLKEINLADELAYLNCDKDEKSALRGREATYLQLFWKKFREIVLTPWLV